MSDRQLQALLSSFSRTKKKKSKNSDVKREKKNDYVFYALLFCDDEDVHRSVRLHMLTDRKKKKKSFFFFC